MAAAVEGAQVDFDTALEIEGRYFVDLATGQVAKNMIQAFFFDLQAVNGDRGRPEDIEPFAAKKVVVLGAGMMGAAIAYVCAKAGIEVVLKDVDQAAAERGKGYSREARRQGRRARQDHAGEGRRAARADHADRPTPADADGADLVIEAVFEDPKVKAQVFAEIEPHLADGALLGSNTSTLPITELAEGVSRPGRLHRPALLLPRGQDAAAGDHQGRADQRRDALPRARRRQADQQDADRRQRLARLLHLARDRHVHQRGHRDARRGRPGAVDRAGLLAGRLPGAGAAALRRAQPEADAQDPQGGARRRRPTAARAGTRTRPSRSSTAMLDEFDRPGKLEGAGFYEYADGKRTRPVAGPARGVPAGRGPVVDLAARPRGADALHRGASRRSSASTRA